MKKTDVTVPQNIILENRETLRVSGVKDIDSFTEVKIVLDTVLGELVIKGEDLHIIALETENGNFSMTGRISSLTYNSFKSGGNVFRRIFR